MDRSFAVVMHRLEAMGPRRRLRYGVMAALALVALLAFLYTRTTGVDVDTQNRVMFDLHELQQVDAEWDTNLLRAHIGRNVADARLAAPLPRIDELSGRLAEALPMTRGRGPRQAHAALVASLRTKAALVAQFRTLNPSLRAALLSMPPALADLKTELGGIEGALAPGRVVVRLDALLNDLLADTLRYNLAPSPALARRIEGNLAQIEAQKDWFSLAVSEQVDALARDTRIILAKRPRENELEARIAATGTAEAMARLGRELDRSFQAEVLERQRWRGFLFAYSILLLALLVYAGWRLRRSYRIINDVNRRLSAANDTLEHRVAERTAELEEQSAKLARLALHDSLTGLINYGQLTRLLELALVRAARRDSVVVAMFIDLDGFKGVNDTWGHATGDLVLQLVARRVQKVLRAEDILARLGGDEFVVMLEGVASPEDALRIARLVLDQIEGINEADGNPVSISASIGIASARGRAGAEWGAAALLADADKAMYAAKQAGKGTFIISPNAHWSVDATPGAA
ncbi:DAHL domain-containing protein [Massilia sp. CMS3.1]|uniref:DAHL domain-containing protein n=1 Tax=Massilia sp. CMS3.1 TaxID=3373083 RepID=UPI003EE6478C